MGNGQETWHKRQISLRWLDLQPDREFEGYLRCETLDAVQLGEDPTHTVGRNNRTLRVSTMTLPRFWPHWKAKICSQAVSSRFFLIH